MLHNALPVTHQMIQKKDDIASGKKVWRGEGNELAYYSICSRELYCVLGFELLEYA